MENRMRYFLAVLLALSASFAQAGTVTVNGQSGATSASADTAWASLRTAHNRVTCSARGLAVSCTQAQLDAACEAGAGQCGKIYATNATGVAQYALDRALALFESAVPEQAAIDKAAAEKAWSQASPAQRAAACQALGKAADCQ
jgi:hypothetical protein